MNRLHLLLKPTESPVAAMPFRWVQTIASALRGCILVAAITCVTDVRLCWASGIELHGLGYLSGGAQSQPISAASGVSFDGSVVVGGSRNAQGGTEPFRWTPATGMIGLGSVTNASVGDAYGVSADGNVVVGASGLNAFYWTPTTGITALPKFAFGYQYQANAVSPNGLYVAGFYYPSVSSNSVATTWTPTIAAANGLELHGITADGSTTVGDGASAGGFQAIRQVNGFTTYLGFLSGTVGNSAATSVTPDGAVVVGYSSSAQGQQAFRWTAANGMMGLGDVISESFASAATAVTADGATIVGTSGDGFGFIWTATAGTRSLLDILTEGGADISGWSELSPLAVSGNGMVIAGQGRRTNGSLEAFVVVVPEPRTTASLLAALVCGGGWVQRKRHRQHQQPSGQQVC